MTLDALDTDPTPLHPTGPLNAHAQLAQQHDRRNATRALAGLAHDRDDFDLLADALGLEAADARAELPALVRTPVLDAPVRARERP